MGDCDCTATPAEQERDSDQNMDRWLVSASVDEPLPEALQAALGSLFETDSVETFDDWVAEITARLDTTTLTVEDLCHIDGESPHVGETVDETYYFRCFYDAVILASLLEEPVDIRTESPDGDLIVAHAAGDGTLSADPSGAVFSFGLDPSVADGDGELTHEALYVANCPYVKAFPDRESYERWADRIAAPTVGMPLEGGTEIASALIES